MSLEGAGTGTRWRQDATMDEQCCWGSTMGKSQFQGTPFSFYILSIRYLSLFFFHTYSPSLSVLSQKTDS